MLDEIEKQFTSEKDSLTSSSKMVRFYDLRDSLLNSRTNISHWDLAPSVESEFHMKYKMIPTAQEDEVTSTCPISPASAQIEAATSEMADAAVALDHASRAGWKEHGLHVHHSSQMQQKKNCTRLQNTFIYEFGTFVVLVIDKKPVTWSNATFG